MEYFKANKWARVQQVNANCDCSNGVRVYCVQWPDRFNFQIRAETPIVDGGKPRNMVATASLTIAEVETILKEMKEYAARTAAA